MLEHAPRLTDDAAARLARDRYGFHAPVVSRLPSERDQNFLVADADGRALILKIANPLEDDALLEAQQRALVHVRAACPLVPDVITARNGATVVPPDAAVPFRAWAVTRLPGRPLGDLVHRPPALLADLGRAAAKLRRAMTGFDHPAVHRRFPWDLATARALVTTLRDTLVDAPVANAVDQAMAQFDRDTAPHLAALPLAVVHNDLNDYNVLVDGTGHVAEWHISGIVDFGDMVHSYAVADLATAAAYASLGAGDPLGAIAHVVRGYHAEAPLSELELRVVCGLAVLRLALSACMAVRQVAQRGDNEYLSISQAAIRETLPRLAAVPFRFAEAVLRSACGLEPHPASRGVRRWLEARAGRMRPVIEGDLAGAVVLDLGPAGSLVSADERENAEPALTRRISAAMADHGAAVGIGRYDEPRLLYASLLFAQGTGALDERRTVHLGIDLFGPAGTPVYAPMDGVVHAAADNAAPLDYGPVVTLEHRTDDGTPFYTLYGHLSRESLAQLAVGGTVRAGDRIGWYGSPEVNGGWPPHLHFQLIVDLLGLGTDFPGVGAPSLRATWRSVSPDPNLVLEIPEGLFPKERSHADAMATRRLRFGANLALSYREPLRIVRGWRQFLFDDEARRYLDGYNNVPHVGHCHPRVVAAVARQLAILNTNTRYVSDVANEYAERLASTLPAPLEVCFFVSSASEANELALRLSRARTGARDVIVLEAAYHGNTTSLVDISPYKHAGPGGAGAPDWVHTVPIPDDYRGPFKREDPHAGEKYAASVHEALVRIGARGGRLSAFIAETCPSVGGQIVFPPGYLAGVYERVRRAGGLCIADEVQTGLGRMGTHCWAFEAQGVVPDIVVAGKPLGNGYPLAAVVTTRAVAEAFDNGMEYFSTFGGSTAACAAGLAVLDVVRDERLQEHARAVGERMLGLLGPLAGRHALVGDIRGSGLFLGIELVRDRGTLEPAAEEAAYVVNRLREQRILIGTDGPLHNVVKIRPPMVFSMEDADLLVDRIDGALAELRWRRTPTLD